MTMFSPSNLLQTFSGQAPLFPLPNVVLFPHATLPLHIFEPRYRQMTADALSGEQLIAMSLLKSDATVASTDDAPPAIHPIVGLGQIIAHERLQDGRYMLILKGVSRARVIQEATADRPYRVGRLELCPEIIPEAVDFDRSRRAEEIVELFCQLFPKVEHQHIVQQAMSADLPMGSICDVIASTLPIGPALAQMFLDEANCDVRSQMLWQLLKRLERREVPVASVTKRFPPSFSSN